jgi:hypothetical protein
MEDLENIPEGVTELTEEEIKELDEQSKVFTDEVIYENQ